jgi:hypothetical protein
MAKPTTSDKKLHAQERRDRRRARLATELRANLLKRKEQARGRARGEAGADEASQSPSSETQIGSPAELPDGRLTRKP